MAIAREPDYIQLMELQLLLRQATESYTLRPEGMNFTEKQKKRSNTIRKQNNNNASHLILITSFDFKAFDFPMDTLIQVDNKRQLDLK